jgi:hypothetical protein
MAGDAPGPSAGSPLLEAILNLSTYHRAHEEFYASSPREAAVLLQRHARTLQALADRWSWVEPTARTAFSPYEGAPDLNDATALQLDGVLFMEGEGRPVELDRLVRDLRTTAQDHLTTGQWLTQAMEASWAVASTLVDVDDLWDVLGERHRIIANDWQAAQMSVLSGRLLERAADMVDRIDLTPAGVRADLADRRMSAACLYSAAELVGRAADLCSDSAGLVHDNERRWRAFRHRVAEVTASTSG